MHRIAASLVTTIRAHEVGLLDSTAIVQSYLNAWNIYSYVCPRVSCVLQQLKLEPTGLVLLGSNLNPARETDNCVHGFRVLADTLRPVEPYVFLAFEDLVCKILDECEPALDRLSDLKSVVCSCIRMHDCSCLCHGCLPPEALRCAPHRFLIKPSDDETSLYSRPGGLEETMLQARAVPEAMCVQIILTRTHFGRPSSVG
jgi:hypothetical protein